MDIDLSKAPEGATHYNANSLHDTWYRSDDGEWLYCTHRNEGMNEWRRSRNPPRWHKEYLTPLPDAWSIYNNTNPLSELTDEQAAELFNWWRNGGKLEHLYPSDGTWSGSSVIAIGVNATYRAKQKSVTSTTQVI